MQHLFRCGQEAEDVYVVRSGRLKLLAHPDAVQKFHDNHVQPDDVLMAQTLPSGEDPSTIYVDDSTSFFNTPRVKTMVRRMLRSLCKMFVVRVLSLLCVQMEVALRSEGALIEELEPVGATEWRHTSEAVAVTNDVVVYVISKELFDKTVQGAETRRQARKIEVCRTIKSGKRNDRVSGLVEAQCRMKEEGIKSSSGIHLRDLGKATASQHEKQATYIHRYKRALNLYDNSIRQTFSSGRTAGCVAGLAI